MGQRVNILLVFLNVQLIKTLFKIKTNLRVNIKLKIPFTKYAKLIYSEE